MRSVVSSLALKIGVCKRFHQSFRKASNCDWMIVFCTLGPDYCLQGISVVEQEQLDNTMIEMDGTENKCELNHDD